MHVKCVCVCVQYLAGLVEQQVQERVEALS